MNTTKLVRLFVLVALLAGLWGSPVPAQAQDVGKGNGNTSMPIGCESCIHLLQSHRHGLISLTMSY